MLVIIPSLSAFSDDHVFRQMIHQIVDLLLQAFLATNDVGTVFANQCHLHIAPYFPGWLKLGAGILQVISH